MLNFFQLICENFCSNLFFDNNFSSIVVVLKLFHSFSNQVLNRRVFLLTRQSFSISTVFEKKIDFSFLISNFPHSFFHYYFIFVRIRFRFIVFCLIAKVFLDFLIRQFFSISFDIESFLHTHVKLTFLSINFNFFSSTMIVTIFEFQRFLQMNHKSIKKFNENIKQLIAVIIVFNRSFAFLLSALKTSILNKQFF